MSGFIKTKSSMHEALYHLEELSYMLDTTNKAIYNQFKELVFLVSASPVLLMGHHWKKHQLCWDSTERERASERGANSSMANSVITLSWLSLSPPRCLSSVDLLLSTYGTRSSATVLPPALLLCWLGGVIYRQRWCNFFVFPVMRLIFLFGKV